jgi:16S rRNA (uracil1498-N3)-methyltransferase
MRAVFCDLDIQAGNSTIVISGERAHHLNVVRVKVGEEILILNGVGRKFYAEIINITKKDVTLKILKFESSKPNDILDLAIAAPKKEAFEDILKISVELGINQIVPLFSQYSQYEYSPSERSARVLESALVQSNNQYLPKILKQVDLDNFLEFSEGQILYFSADQTNCLDLVDLKSKIIILIGPEAGFSSVEEAKIKASSKVKVIHLKTPILRAPTAVAAAVGYILGLGIKAN